MKRKVIAGALWFAGQNVARQVISFALFVALGRMLSPANFGTVSLSASVIAIIQAFSSQGITQAVIQRSDLTEDEAEIAYTFNLLFCTTIAATLIGGCALFWYVAPPPLGDLPLVLAALATLLPLSAFYEMHQARLARSFDFHIIAGKALAGQVIGGLIAVMAAYAGANVWSLVAQQFVALTIEMAVIRSVSSWQPKLRLESKFIVHLWHFGAHLFGARLLSTIDARGPDLIIGMFSGQTPVGFFRVAKQMLDVVVSVFAYPVSSVSLPLFAAERGHVDRVRLHYLRLTEALCWLLTPPCLTLVLWAPQILTFVFGQNWRSSGSFLQILAFQGVVLGMFYLYDPLLVALGKTKEVFALRCWQTGLSFCCMLSGGFFGAESIVAGQVVALFLTTPIFFRYISSAAVITLNDFLAHVWKPNVCALAFVSVAKILDSFVGASFGISGLVAALAVGYFGYGVLFYLFASKQLRSEFLALAGRVMRPSAS